MLHRLAELDRAVRDGYAAYDFQRVFQTLFQFCTVDLSAFYFDIRKDALYCDAADRPAPPRRAHRARRALPPARHLAGADAGLHHGGGLAGALPRRGRARCTCRTSPPRRRTGSTPRWPRSGRRSAAPAASSPARWRSSAATSASAPASRPRRWCTSPTRRSSRRWPRSTSPTSASPRTSRLTDAAGAGGRLHARRRPRRRRGAGAGRGREVRALLEDPAGRRQPRAPRRLRPLRRGVGLTGLRRTASPLGRRSLRRAAPLVGLIVAYRGWLGDGVSAPLPGSGCSVAPAPGRSR